MLSERLLIEELNKNIDFLQNQIDYIVNAGKDKYTLNNMITIEINKEKIHYIKSLINDIIDEKFDDFDS